MKKFVFIILCLFLIPLNAFASYNGGSGGGKAPSGSQCPTASWAIGKLCTWNNEVHGTVKVSIYHFNSNGTRDLLGRSVVYTNNDWRDLGFYTLTGGSCSRSSMNGKDGFSSAC